MRLATRLPYLILVLLLVICFSLATSITRPSGLRAHEGSDDVMAAMLGESRRLFANHFFVKADAYFHSGFYPTIFDNQVSFQTPHMAEDAGALKSRNRGEETQFMGKPRDVIEEFTRHFMPSVHTHLDEGGPQGLKPGSDLGEEGGGDVREILPWLQLSAELDPNRIETYMVTAYWLRKRMGKVDEAETFLREGLNANPGNPSLLFELGRVYYENRKEINRPRNIWAMAVDKLDAMPEPHTDEQNFMLMQLTLNLARLEEGQTNLPATLHWLKRLETVSPQPEQVRQEIEETKRKIAQAASQHGTNPP